MCVIYIAVGRSTDHPLVLLANRDEYFDRPTLPASFWDDDPNIYGGRDLVGGGTWLGVAKSGRFAAVTNYRDPKAPSGSLSRGGLVADYLRSSESPGEYLEQVRNNAASYSGFNLLVGQVSYGSSQLCYFSNRAAEITTLSEGLYGLSNHLLDSPWPKVVKGKQRFARLLDRGNVSNNEYFEVLADETLADDHDLPATGIPFEVEKAISGIFIKTPGYGTRCSTVLKFDNDLKWTLEERTFR